MLNWSKSPDRDSETASNAYTVWKTISTIRNTVKKEYTHRVNYSFFLFFPLQLVCVKVNPVIWGFFPATFVRGFK